MNAGTWLVLTILVVIVGAILYCQIKAKKKGKTSCGSGCSHCANNGFCHRKM